MEIDFGTLGASAPEPARGILEPRDLFSALPEKSPMFGYLRGPQDQVLAAWHGRRDDRDVVIKMNTGGGKTTVGLLIARSWLNEGLRPVAYLVADVFLESQVLEEARKLGIECTDQAEDAAFQRGDAVLVCTFAKLFNARSVFGVAGSYGRSVKYGLAGVVVDDAHACIQRADSEFRIRIPRDEDAYEALLKIFEGDLREQSHTSVMDLEERRPRALSEVPFWAWQKKITDVLAVLHPLSSENYMEWSWPLVAESIANCTAVFGSDYLDIWAPIIPTDMFTGFADAQRRVYLTATLTDDSALVRHFGVEPRSACSPIFPSSAGDIGDRMILVPQQLVPGTTDHDVLDYVEELASDKNVVVIVPSRARAQFWEPIATEILDRDSIESGVERLRSAPPGSVVVMVNRYDGVDLPGDACRVLIIDGLPEASGTSEFLEQTQLKGSGATLSQQVQRLEQGMGRATRSNDDHAVVMLVGRGLAHYLNSGEARHLFSPATRAQLALADAVAGSVRAGGPTCLEDLTGIVNQFLSRDPGWVRESRGRLAQVRYELPRVGEDAEQERLAFADAVAGRTDSALAHQRRAAEVLSADPLRRAQATQRLASYTFPVSEVEAQGVQRAAYEANRTLLKPVGGIRYEKLAKAADAQASVACHRLQEAYPTGNALILGFAALVDSLDWGERTDEFEEAFNSLGLYVGVATQRPDAEFREGPDNLWSIPTGGFLVVEAKSGVTSERDVTKKEAAQLSNSVDWFQERYLASPKVPVLVHPSSRFDRQAAVPVGCRVIDRPRLEKLRKATETFARRAASDEAFRSSKRLAVLLAETGLIVSIQPSTGTFLERFTTPGHK